MTEKYLTAEDAARYLRSSRSTLAKRRVNGTGPIFVRIGRAVRYRQSDVDAWLALSASSRAVPKHRLASEKG